MTTREQTLSELVMTYIDSLEHDDLGLTPEEFAESQKIRAMISIIVNDLIKSRETLTDNKLEAIERAVEAEPEITKGWLDQRFTKDAVEVVSGYVNRTMQLSRMKSDRLPSKIANGYLREAIHTYILGLPQASVALSRAALEQALKEGVGYQSTRTFVKMNDLLEEAETAGVIDKVNRDLSRNVANAADEVSHERQTTLKDAFDVLLQLRGVLKFIYSQE